MLSVKILKGIIGLHGRERKKRRTDNTTRPGKRTVPIRAGEERGQVETTRKDYFKEKNTSIILPDGKVSHLRNAGHRRGIQA